MRALAFLAYATVVLVAIVLWGASLVSRFRRLHRRINAHRRERGLPYEPLPPRRRRGR